MKGTTAYAFIWISSAIAISVAIIVTGKIGALWALLIPALVSYNSDNEE
ncbi:hypothetical protein KHA93_11690 [Bacillus sp. FJAT-49732]|uniref:Uncharacterized protein n=1 Tax=Lederbergia citrisecunda TaxID=2833583 RepID=A0A942TN08_9BACI|nr:hypothetical protein [Lederbergia citrisecunda]MBS4200293.1 hypothetical protein [Lederbergia citrisecunda]